METVIVGPQAVADGNKGEMRGTRSRAGVITNLHGRYFEQTFRGNIFTAANQAAQAVSVALATTYTGLCLYNPINSGIVAVPNLAKFALSVAPAAIAPIGLIQGYASTGGVTAQTTKLTIQSSQIGNAASGKCIALSAATIVAPTWLAQLYDGFTAGALPAPQPPFDLQGLYEILPGGFIAFGALTAVTGLGSISWEEILI